MSETTMRFEAHVIAKCPCGLEIQSGEILHGDKRIPAVIHEEPHCDKFRDLDVVDFLHWVNVMHGAWN